MATLKSNDGKNFIVNCRCGCDEGIRLEIRTDDYDYYAIVTYMNGHFYGEQNNTPWRIFCKKMRKIFAVIMNKDFYYSEVIMNRDDFDSFKEYINSI